MSETKLFTYTCRCGAVHPAGIWAVEHWSEELTHTCDFCQRVNTIRNGWVIRSRSRLVRPQRTQMPGDAQL